MITEDVQHVTCPLIYEYLSLCKKWDGIVEFWNLINFSPYLPQGNYSINESAHIDPTARVGSLDNVQVVYMNYLNHRDLIRYTSYSANDTAHCKNVYVGRFSSVVEVVVS